MCEKHFLRLICMLKRIADFLHTFMLYRHYVTHSNSDLLILLNLRWFKIRSLPNCAEVVDGIDFMTSLCQDRHRQASWYSFEQCKLHQPASLCRTWHNDVIYPINHFGTVGWGANFKSSQIKKNQLNFDLLKISLISTKLV